MSYDTVIDAFEGMQIAFDFFEVESYRHSIWNFWEDVIERLRNTPPSAH